MTLQPYRPEEDKEEGLSEFTLCGDIKAGFPSPADDIQEKLDIVKMLVAHPASTFFFRVSGLSMVDASIDEGDIIVVDKAKDPKHGDVAVCFLDGEFTLKRLSINSGGVSLLPANSDFPAIKVSEEDEFTIWGVVTFVIKKL